METEAKQPRGNRKRNLEIPHPNQKWLDELQVAWLTQRSVQTLRNDRVQKTGFPFSKFARMVRYDRDDVERVMNAHKVKTEE